MKFKLRQIFASGRIRFLALSLSLLVAVTAIYWKIFGYPFIYDDWGILNSIIYHDPIAYLGSAFSPLGKIFYRPLGSLYFEIAYFLFKLDPAGFHAVAFLLHYCNSLLAVSIVRHVSKNLFFAWIAGFLYAAAITVHMEPLLWMAGFYDVGGSFFLLSSMLLFLRGRKLFSALTFFLGILTKEAVVVLPAVLLFAVPFMQGNQEPRPSSLKSLFSKIWMHVSFLTIYLVLKGLGRSPLTLPDNDELKISFAGSHIFGNLERYAQWAAGSILPVKESFMGNIAFTIILVLIGAISVILWRVDYSARDDTVKAHRLKLLLFWGNWFILGLLPVLFLKHHIARYFFVYSLLPFLVLGSNWIWRLFSLLRCKRSLALSALIVLVFLNVGFSSLYFLEKDREGKRIQGTYNLIYKAALTNDVRSFLLKEYPELPRGAILVFYGLDTKYFSQSAGPQIWYNDTSLSVYQGRPAETDSTGTYFLTSPGSANPRDKVYLDRGNVFVIVLYDGRLEKYDFPAYNDASSHSINRRGD